MSSPTSSQLLQFALRLLAILLVGTIGASCAADESPLTQEVVAVMADVLPSTPDDPAWDELPLHRAELTLQDLVEPRQLEHTTPHVDVRAATDGRQLAVRLSWPDATVDELPGASRFSDACAVQLPSRVAANVPAPQMGETDGAVEITYWRASWQASAAGRGDTINDLYPGARIDHYPFEAAALDPGSIAQRALADQYAPARALGNVMEGPRARAVEDLVAEGPGTLHPSPRQESEGHGGRDGQSWQVVIVRPLPADVDLGERTQIAFAIWDGRQHEVGARKMRSVWIPLLVGGATVADHGSS